MSAAIAIAKYETGSKKTSSYEQGADIWRQEYLGNILIGDSARQGLKRNVHDVRGVSFQNLNLVVMEFKIAERGSFGNSEGFVRKYRRGSFGTSERPFGNGSEKPNGRSEKTVRFRTVPFGSIRSEVVL